jgi:hypothetical protein
MAVVTSCKQIMESAPRARKIKLRVAVGTDSSSVWSKRCKTFCLSRLASTAAKGLKGVRLSHDDDLQVAFDQGTRLRAAAANHSVHHSQILPSRLKVSFVGRSIVLDELRKWRDRCRRKPPLTALHLRKFDSAKFVMANPAVAVGVGAVTPNQSVRPIDCFVQRRCLAMVWPDEAVELHFPMTTTPMQSTNANSARTALDLSVQAEPFQTLAYEVLRTASDFSAELDGSDGAYAHAKYTAWRHAHPNAGDEAVCRDSIWCGNHLMHIGDVAFKEATCKTAMDLLKSLVTLFRSSVFFSERCLCCIPLSCHR